MMKNNSQLWPTRLSHMKQSPFSARTLCSFSLSLSLRVNVRPQHLFSLSLYHLAVWRLSYY